MMRHSLEGGGVHYELKNETLHKAFFSHINITQTI